MSLKIPCVICDKKYELWQVGFSLFITTGVCWSCYAEGQLAPADEWCFGKPVSYDVLSAECSITCPDRTICVLFIQRLRAKPEVSPDRVAENAL